MTDRRISHIYTFPAASLTDYISWPYFFHAWQFAPRFASVAAVHTCPGCQGSWVSSFPEADQPQAKAALTLFHDALDMLRVFQNEGMSAQAKVVIVRAASRDDDIVLPTEGIALPMLRQQGNATGRAPFLCLSDFIRPETAQPAAERPDDAPDVADHIGIFAAATDQSAEDLFPDDPYRHMLSQTLADRLAEAATELMHLRVRRELWGYSPWEQLTQQELLTGKFQGIRPAVGYPCLPDQSLIFILNDVLGLGEIGIRLTESGAMRPHAATCGLIFAHPAARYFDVGRIDRHQFSDYAHRRGMDEARLRPFLARVLE